MIIKSRALFCGPSVPLYCRQIEAAPLPHPLQSTLGILRGLLQPPHCMCGTQMIGSMPEPMNLVGALVGGDLSLKSLQVCFCTNQSIKRRAILTLSGMEGSSWAPNHPASMISLLSMRIFPPAYSAVKAIISEWGKGQG